jgi:hypothetical protein
MNNELNVNHDKYIHYIEFDKSLFTQFDIARIIADNFIKYIDFVNQDDGKYVLIVNEHSHFQTLFKHNLCEGLDVIDGILNAK